MPIKASVSLWKQRHGTAKPSAWEIASNLPAKVYVNLRQTLNKLTTSPGGWDPITNKISENLDEEIDQAFSNVDLNLKDAGGKGWSQVFRVNIYCVTNLNEQAFAAMLRNFKKWMPDHQPIFTLVGVTQLGLPEMRIEIEVSAHDEEGAKAVAASRK
jgi:enamine deaminase RidA (YjgF/YER057c/UK114 family)